MNSNLNLTAYFDPIPPISSHELTVAIEHLEKFITSYSKTKYDFSDINPQFPIKVAYELGYYYFLLSSCLSSNTVENIIIYSSNYKKYFKLALNFLETIERENQGLLSSFNFTYFDKHSPSLMLNIWGDFLYNIQNLQVYSNPTSISSIFNYKIEPNNPSTRSYYP